MFPRLLAMLLLAGTPLAGNCATDTGSPPIDFSYAGFGGGGVALPDVPALTRVRPSGGDDTAMLQAALDWLGMQPTDANGYRGAVQLSAGRYVVSGSLRLAQSGVVLRGNVEPNAPSILVAAGKSRRTLIELGTKAHPLTTPSHSVVDETVPAGATTFHLDSVEGITVGSRVVVQRPSTVAWIAALGMNQAPGNFADQRIHWLPGSRDLTWDRTVVAVDPKSKQINLDAPVTTALERRYGAATIQVSPVAPTKNIGVESLVVESEYDASRPTDEEHAWVAIALHQVEDAWVREVSARHFVSSVVRVGPRARRVTISGCASLEPVSELGGYRRQSFLVEGQQVLVQHCRAENGWNDFVVGQCAAGPNVFLDCVAMDAHNQSGAFESWASGTLFENVTIRGASLRLTKDFEHAQGGGWTAANSVVWNCEAKTIEVSGTDEAPNLAQKSDQPLYATQLKHRLGASAASSALPPTPLMSTTATTAQREVAEFVWKPASASSLTAAAQTHPVQIVGGRFVVDGRILWGGQFNAGWWKGQTSAAIAAQVSGRSITRFVPGRAGPGLTEELPDFAQDLVDRGLTFYSGGPGLWYDRRRDDHLLIPRATADVWAPFFELPWARSGKGTAWDGLSKYDLSQYNPWFFARTRAFAQIFAERGLVLYHSLYNTHNILETYAHYTDYAWRTANCINDIGLPEPPPLDAGNTVHLNPLVYSVDDPGRRALHRAYLRHTLDQLGDQPNVIFSLGFQFAGPLAFQQFFLDTLDEWERQTGRTVRVALITSKDITDAIMADPARARHVAVIDIRYWQRQSDGTLWAPRGDVNRAFREQNTVLFGRGVDLPPDTTALNVYRGVREYRDRFPDRAIVAWNGGAGPIPVLMAGGAQVLQQNPAAGQSQRIAAEGSPVDILVRKDLGTVLPDMTPKDGWFSEPDKTWCLADAGSHVLVYSLTGDTVRLTQTLPHSRYELVWINPETGERIRREATPLSAGLTLPKPTAAPWLLLMTAAE